MPTYGLPVRRANGAKVRVRALDGGLGYEHLRIRDAEGVQWNIASVPAQSPPVGKFPITDASAGEWLLAFEVIAATGDGPALLFRAWMSTRITERTKAMQLGDQPRLVFDMFDDLGPLDLANAQLLEVVCRRADKSEITKPGTASTPSGGAVANRLTAQLDVDEVNSAGDWLIQSHAILEDGREFWSTIRRVAVLHNV